MKKWKNEKMKKQKQSIKSPSMHLRNYINLIQFNYFNRKQSFVTHAQREGGQETWGTFYVSANEFWERTRVINDIGKGVRCFAINLVVIGGIRTYRPGDCKSKMAVLTLQFCQNLCSGRISRRRKRRETSETREKRRGCAIGKWQATNASPSVNSDTLRFRRFKYKSVLVEKKAAEVAVE